MKMSQSAILMAVLTATVAGSASAADRWLCTADKATGFDRDQGSGWKVATLEVERKLIVSRPSALQRNSGFAGADYVVRVIGEEIADAGCRTSQEWAGSQILNCRGSEGDYTFGFASGRYLYSSHVEYLIGKGEGAETPFIEIGECSAL